LDRGFSKNYRNNGIAIATDKGTTSGQILFIVGRDRRVPFLAHWLAARWNRPHSADRLVQAGCATLFRTWAGAGRN